MQQIVSKLYESNTFVLENNDEVLIVDAGVTLEEVKKCVGDKKVVGILLTHGHFDHSYYISSYIEEFKTKAYASKFAKEYLADHKKNYSSDFGLNMNMQDFKDFVFLENSGSIKIGSFLVEFGQLGGHSKSDIFFKVGAYLFVGDVIIGRGIGRMDLYGGNKAEMLKSLKILANVEYETMCCGHEGNRTKEAQDKVISTYIKFLSR